MKGTTVERGGKQERERGKGERKEGKEGDLVHAVSVPPIETVIGLVRLPP